MIDEVLHGKAITIQSMPDPPAAIYYSEQSLVDAVRQQAK